MSAFAAWWLQGKAAAVCGKDWDVLCVFAAAAVERHCAYGLHGCLAALFF